MLTTTEGFCAACHGEIVAETHARILGATSVDLCAACMDLSDPTTPKGLTRMLALIAERADPEAPVEDTEKRIEAWLELRAQE